MIPIGTINMGDRKSKRDELYRRGFWGTAKGEQIRVANMESSHLINVLKMIICRAQGALAKIVAFYCTLPYPNGEMAQYVFDREIDFWEEVTVYDLLEQHPFINCLLDELSSRQLAKDDSNLILEIKYALELPIELF